MKRILIIVFTCLLSLNHNAQHVIEMPLIDIIAYDNNADYYLFQKESDNNYRAIYLSRNSSDEGISYKIHTINSVTINDINKKYDHVIYTNTLQSLTINNFKEILSQNKWKLHNAETDEENVALLRSVTEDIACIYELVYTKKLSGGFGSFETSKDDNIKKWRIVDTEYLHTIVLNLGNEKYMTVYLERNFVKGILLPLVKNTLLIINNYKPIQDSNMPTIDKKYKFNRKELLKYFDPSKFYKIKKDVNQYRLTNIFGDDKLGKAFDTISISPHYVISKTSNDISIYNSSLEKVEIPKLHQAYFYRSGLEIMDHSGAFYLDNEGKKIDAFPPISYLVCGTVSSSKYEILKDSISSIYSISHTSGYSDTSQFGEKLQIRGLPKNSKVSFLDNSNRFFWDGNSSFVGEIFMRPDLLKITHNGKVGIYTYNTKKSKIIEPRQEYFITKDGDTIKKVTPINLIENGYVKATEILPAIYKDIEMNIKNGLVYFYKDNKVGIYPRHQVVQYNSIKQITESFYKITKNGKIGWLDIKTNKEYF